MQLIFNRTQITNLYEWENEFVKDSKKQNQWEDDFSAKEFAKLVLNGNFEKDVSSVLVDFPNLEFVQGEVEKKISNRQFFRRTKKT